MSTYIPLQSITLTSTATTVTFSGIPQTYTDLILVTGDILNPTNLANMYFQFNDDGGSNYSRTWFEGTGSSSASSRDSNQTSMKVGRSYGGNRTINIFHFQNYSNITTNKTVIGRSGSGDTSSSTVLSIGLWRSTAAINKIVIGIEGGIVFSSGCTFTLYGIAAGTAKAIGGEVTVTGGFAYHTFRQSGQFIPSENLSVDYVVVGGGGGGGFGVGNEHGGGGGGAGGYRTATGISLTSSIAYAVTVGSGGTGGSTYPLASQTNGTNSALDSFTSAGGGCGGNGANNAGTANGGSGGGAGSKNLGGTAGSGNTPSTSPSQGNNGGTTSHEPQAGAGGGGAGGVGASVTGNFTSTGGAGGAGSNSVSTWATATGTGVSGFYAGGGGGGGAQNPGGGTGGAGGSGGGGAGGSSGGNGVAGTVNTGGGGGGGSGKPAPTTGLGANGGSGIVIVRYAV
jgi:hypothetical protein